MSFGFQESYNCKSWKRFEMMLKECKIYKDKTKSLHDQMITRKEFHFGDNLFLSFMFEFFS